MRCFQKWCDRTMIWHCCSCFMLLCVAKQKNVLLVFARYAHEKYGIVLAITPYKFQTLITVTLYAILRCAKTVLMLLAFLRYSHEKKGGVWSWLLHFRNFKLWLRLTYAENCKKMRFSTIIKYDVCITPNTTTFSLFRIPSGIYLDRKCDSQHRYSFYANISRTQQHNFFLCNTK